MNDLQLHLVHADLLTIGPAWNARDVRSTFWRLYINNRDGAGVWCAEGLYPLPARHIHLIPAYVKFSCRNDVAIQHLYVHFDMLGITPILQQQVFPTPLSLPISSDARRLAGMYARGRFPQTCPVSMCLTHAVILRSLSQCIEALPEGLRQHLQSAFAAPNPIRPALQRIEQRLPRDTSVSELADACALSPDHFGRVFRHIVGQTPGQYVRQRRIALAARRLLYGEQSIDAIAMEHCFANRFHFTRAFSREMGITPAAYRTSQRV